MKKPDFIIIGAMKSATSTLHEQLALQDGIFMSTPKEPNFFSDDEQFARGEAWYEDLFAEAKPSDICGESSTHYTKLPDHPQTIERIKATLSHVPKLIYVIRHPIDRLVSHYIHQWTQNKMTGDINIAINRYPELVAYSQYAKQLKPYIESFGIENVHITFSEALRVHPQQELDKIAKFLNCELKLKWYENLPKQNVSSERLRKFPGYSIFVQSRLSAWLRRRLIPQALRDSIKSRLQMRERPVISQEQTMKLKTAFDEDLGILSELLGVELNCDNFKEVAISR